MFSDIPVVCVGEWRERERRRENMRILRYRRRQRRKRRIWSVCEGEDDQALEKYRSSESEETEMKQKLRV